MKTTAKQYAQVLYDLTKGKTQNEIDALVLKFAEELKFNRKTRMLNKVVDNFYNIYNKENGILEAEVVSAKDLPEEQLSQVKKFLKDKYGANEVTLKNTVDAEVIGGVIIKTGDDVIDGSVAGRLKGLRNSLKK